MYEFSLSLALPFERAAEALREALAAEHLGIVSDVDVQAVLRNKLGKEIPAYHIYGACNPKLADRVIGIEPNAGVLLPCNIVLREAGDGSTVVSFMEPATVLGLAQSAEAATVGAEARAMLERVAARLSD